MTGKRWFWLAVALQVLLLLGMVGRHSYTVATGRPVLLQTAPVDPWDPFRGEYVRLNYVISRIETGGSTPISGGPFRRGQTVWVLLEPGDPHWNAVGVYARRPAEQGSQVALRGRVEYSAEGWTGQPAFLAIRYGIEQFYVPEGEGPGLERQQLNMTVEALVDSFGRAALHKVLVDGKEIRWR